MRKAIKIIAIFLGGLILLALATIVALLLFINPNDYKPQITQKVQEYTGRQLTLEGNIGWSFFPWLGLQINDARLSNAPGFGDRPFATIKKADVSVALLPLLSRKIELGKITLNGVELNLIKNKNGATNWEDLGKRAGQKKISENNRASVAKNYSSAFALAGIDVNDGRIRWQDQQAQKAYEISDLQLHSEAVKLAEAFPLNLSFIVREQKTKIKIDLHGEVTADPQQEIVKINRLRLKVEDSTLTGVISASGFAKTSWSFNLHLDHINLNRYSPAKTANDDIIGKGFFISTATAAPLPPATNGLLPVELLRGVNAKGQLQVASLQLGILAPTDISLQLKAANGLLSFNPITAKIYQGVHNGDLNVDVRGAEPHISSRIQLQNIQAEPLFRDMSNITRLDLTGVGNFTAQLTTQGNSSQALAQRLAGQGKLTFSNGILKGIDIPYWINAGRTLLHKQLPPAQHGPAQTDFGNLSASFVINNGIVKNEDLLLRSANWQAKGKGTVDLVNQQLDYQLAANILRADGQSDSMVIPLHISGAFNNIKIRPAVETVVKEQLKERIGVELGKHLDKDLSGKLKNSLDSIFK